MEGAVKEMKFINIFIAVAMVFVLFGCDSRAKQYDEAKRLLNDGNYSEAINSFEVLGDYNDSLQQADHARKSLAFGEWFEDVSWDGTNITLTIKQDITLEMRIKESAESKSLIDVSDFEHGGFEIYDSENLLDIFILPGSYSMPLAKFGSAYCVAAGNTICCEVKTSGAKPDKIVVTLEDGTVLEKSIDN